MSFKRLLLTTRSEQQRPSNKDFHLYPSVCLICSFDGTTKMKRILFMETITEASTTPPNQSGKKVEPI